MRAGSPGTPLWSRKSSTRSAASSVTAAECLLGTFTRALETSDSPITQFRNELQKWKLSGISIDTQLLGLFDKVVDRVGVREGQTYERAMSLASELVVSHGKHRAIDTPLLGIGPSR